MIPSVSDAATAMYALLFFGVAVGFWRACLIVVSWIDQKIRNVVAIIRQ